jgi:RNA polymerase primary sigma factor
MTIDIRNDEETVVLPRFDTLDQLAEGEEIPDAETIVPETEPADDAEDDPEAALQTAETLAEVEGEVAMAQSAIDAEFLEQGVLELLGIYLHEVRRVPLLTAEEEISLSRAYDNGRAAQTKLTRGESDREERLQLDHTIRTGERARRRLVESNLRLVISVARKHLNRGLPLPDLIQEGNIGLSRAVDKFDWRRGFRFSTYAYWWIRQAITRAIADQSRVVRIPVHMSGQISRYARASSRLAQELGREPSVDEVAAWLDIPVSKAEEIHQAAQVPVSLDAPVGEENDSYLGDFVEDASQPTLIDAVSKRLLKESVGEVMDSLNPRERKVVELRFGLGDGRARTLAEVGDELQISRERVRQIESDALRKLRRPTVRRKLAEYLN